MKKCIYLLFALLYLTPFNTSAQVGYMDYKNGALFSSDGVVYRITNKFESFMQDELALKKGVYININNLENIRMDKTGQYTDGHYAEDPDEVSGIIQGKQSNDDTVYAAVRKAFTKEELMAHSDWIIFVFVVVNKTGRIIETASCIRIHPNYVIQPEQVHILETTLKNTLVFTLDQEKASKFKWFEGQIMIRFKDYIEDRPLTKIDNFIESPNL